MTHLCYQQQWEAEPHSWLIHATNNNEKQSLIHATNNNEKQSLIQVTNNNEKQSLIHAYRQQWEAHLRVAASVVCQ